MIQLVFLSLIGFTAYKIVFESPTYASIWYIIAMLIIPPGVYFIGKPIIWFLTIFLLINLLQRKKSHLLGTFPLKKTIGVFVLLLLIVGIFDQRIDLVQKLLRPTIFIFENIVPMILLYWMFLNAINLNQFLKILIFFFIIVSIYGVFTWLSLSNPYINILSNEFVFRNISEEYMKAQDGRLRISSFFFHPYLYSIILYFIIIYFVSFYKSINETLLNSSLYLAFVLILISLNFILTDSRATLVILVLSLILIFLIEVKNINIVFRITALFFIFLLCLQIPVVADKFQQVFDLFESENSKVQGSNISMRELQFLASLKYFEQNPIFGNGFYYIYENLGFRVNLEQRSSDSEFFAFESYLYILLIEQGIIGILSHIFLFASLITYFIGRRKYATPSIIKMCNVCIIITLGYISFILATGTINSMAIFFALIGVNMGLIERNIMVNNINRK